MVGAGGGLSSCDNDENLYSNKMMKNVDNKSAQSFCCNGIALIKTETPSVHLGPMLLGCHPIGISLGVLSIYVHRHKYVSSNGEHVS